MKTIEVDKSFRAWAGKGREILLLIRTKDGQYVFIDNEFANKTFPDKKLLRPPTGSIEKFKEEAFNAARRELKEEFGIDSRYVHFVRPLIVRINYSDGDGEMFTSYIYKYDLTEDIKLEFKDKSEHVEKIYRVPKDRFLDVAKKYDDLPKTFLPKEYFPGEKIRWKDWGALRAAQIKELYATESI